MPRKNIAELPKQRAEFGKAYRANKEKQVKDEPSVVIEDDDMMTDLKKMSESWPEKGKKDKKEGVFEYTEELKKMFEKPVEKPSGIARLFGSAQGMTRRIGDYFTEAKKWVEFQFAKKELAKRKTKENILQSIEENEDPIDMSAFKEVLEGTSEAVDMDVSEFAERNENGLANLEAKSEDAEAGDEIPEETRKFMESLEREAEEAREEFKDEMSDEEYDVRAKEAKEILSDEKESKKRTENKEPKIEKQTEAEFDAEKYEKIKDDLDYKKRVLKDTQKYAKQTPASLRKITNLTKEIIALEKAKKEMEKRPQWDDVDTSEFDEDARVEAELKDVEKRLKLRKKVLEDTKKYVKQTSAALKKVTQLTKEVMALEEEKGGLEKKLKGESKEETMSGEKYEARDKEAKDISEEDVEVKEFEETDEEKVEREFFEKGEKEEKEQSEAPFGKKVIDESHRKYLEIKEYEEEHGEAPEGDSSELYLSFSYQEYQDALEKNSKKAEKMEEEMYEKLAIGSVKPKSEGRRKAPKGKIKTSIRGERW